MAGHPASTIHRRIYRGDLLGMGMPSGPVVNVNRLKEAVYIVDEASMIGDDTEGDIRRGSLLDDLVEYVFSQPGSSMILLGDPAQLPPVGLDISPALDVARLKRGGMTVSRAVMTEVCASSSTAESSITPRVCGARCDTVRSPLRVSASGGFPTSGSSKAPTSSTK